MSDKRERAGGRRSRPGDFELRFRKPDSAIGRFATMDAALGIAMAQARAMGRPVEVRRIGADGKPCEAVEALVEPEGDVEIVAVIPQRRTA